MINYAIKERGVPRSLDKKILFCSGHPGYAEPFLDICEVHYDERLLAQSDIMLLTGGEDIDPAIYHEPPHPTTYWTTSRDKLEIELVEKALSLRIPIFGTCRGLQLLHAINGGKLVQDVANHMGSHHDIITNKGKKLTVNSIHHQVCRADLPDDVMIVLAESYSEGYVEAAYYPKTQCLGVQFHPECMDERNPARRWTIGLVKELLFSTEGGNFGN